MPLSDGVEKQEVLMTHAARRYLQMPRTLLGEPGPLPHGSLRTRRGG